MLAKNDYRKICKQLKLFGFKNYKDFIDSNLWKEYRNILYKRDLPKRCSICNKKSDLLCLHHKTYKRLLDPELVTWVCKECHDKVHKEVCRVVQEATDNVIVEIGGGKFGKRENSLRIIPSSGLPAVLHHSIHASGLVCMIRNGDDIEEVLEKYQKRKRKCKDLIILDLLEKNYSKVLKFLGTFTTN